VAWKEFVLKELHTGYVEIYNVILFHTSIVGDTYSETPGAL
jgi:hypothetical protein